MPMMMALTAPGTSSFSVALPDERATQPARDRHRQLAANAATS